MQASTVIIVMNIETYEQTLLQGHTDEIVSVGFLQDKKLLAAA